MKINKLFILLLLASFHMGFSQEIKNKILDEQTPEKKELLKQEAKDEKSALKEKKTI